MALPTDISNPSYMGFKSSSVSSRSGASGHGAKDGSGNISPKKTGYDHSMYSPTGKASSPV